MPRGYWVDYIARHQYGYDYQARQWVADPNGPEWRDPPLVQFLKLYSGCWVICLLLLAVLLGVPTAFFFVHDWLYQQQVQPNEFVIDSQWQGLEYQYRHGNLPSNTAGISINVDSIANGTFAATVQWPGNTVTHADGIIVTNISDKRWQYVINPNGTSLQFTECSKGAVYLQFTETSYVQGNSVVLNTSYYAIACGDKISGVWFWPNTPHDGLPGGEFTLSKQ